MCGITGFVGRKGDLPLDVQCQAMVDQLIHRGPDENNVWSDEKYKISLGHSRLAIQDLSAFGRQPMFSREGRYVIIFNGEIYNHLELRKELIDHGYTPNQWRGHSDTETLLACIEVWGLEKALKKLTGMFAFALWDKSNKLLHLSRDRIGEKPLYYGFQNEVFLFGSELKALKAHPSFQNEMDRNVITLQLRYNYIPAPYSIYKGIKKLLPGTVLTLPLSEKGVDFFELPEPKSYWSFENVVTSAQSDTFKGSEQEAIDRLDFLLRKSVKRQMISDVPLGAFLSGGIDSSAIVALMQAQSEKPIKTFSIGFHEKEFNEATYAKAVAEHLSTDHTEMYVSPKEAMDVIPELPTIFDEPFSDSSQIPTYLVSKMTKEHVTVSLSGDAGDELFGGYNRYFWTNNIWSRIRLAPLPLRYLLSKSLTCLSPDQWNKIAPIFMRVLPSKLRLNNFGDKAHKLAGLLTNNSIENIYRGLVSHWNEPSQVVIGGKEPETLFTSDSDISSQLELEHRMMYLDTLTYLPDDILTKVDRSAMAVSLETRVPFLDHEIVEFAWKLPLNLKVRNGEGKWILRRVLDKYVPEDLIKRPKMGFGVPIDTWLRGPLREWAEELLNPSRLKQEQFLNYSFIEQKWNEHQSGQRNWQYLLWDILMFQAWLEHNG
jgi:asparagine synthase (glutamine-hydrolysing)